MQDTDVGRRESGRATHDELCADLAATLGAHDAFTIARLFLLKRGQVESITKNGADVQRRQRRKD